LLSLTFVAAMEEGLESGSGCCDVAAATASKMPANVR
jgi:hypothetical protein